MDTNLASHCSFFFSLNVYHLQKIKMEKRHTHPPTHHQTSRKLLQGGLELMAACRKLTAAQMERSGWIGVRLEVEDGHHASEPSRCSYSREGHCGEIDYYGSSTEGHLAWPEGEQGPDASPIQLLMPRLLGKRPTLSAASEEDQAIPQPMIGIHMGNGLHWAG